MFTTTAQQRFDLLRECIKSSCKAPEKEEQMSMGWPDPVVRSLVMKDSRDLDDDQVSIVVLDAGNEVLMWFLPGVFEYFTAVGLEYVYTETSSLATRIVRYAAELAAEGLLPLVLDCVEAMYFSWLRVAELHAYPDGEAERSARYFLGTAAVMQRGTKDDFLGAWVSETTQLSSKYLHAACSGLVDRIMTRWASDEITESQALHLADMLAASTYPPDRVYNSDLTMLYGTPVVARLRANRDLARELIKGLSPVWQRKGFPVWYIKEVKERLGFP